MLLSTHGGRLPGSGLGEQVARCARFAAEEVGEQGIDSREAALLCSLVHAEREASARFRCALGAVLTLLSTPPDERDSGLADAMYEAILREILTDAPEVPESGPIAAAVAFRALAPGLDMLSDAEQKLLSEWLDRAIDGL